MNLKNSIILGVICLIVGGIASRYLLPPKEVTKIQTVEKEVIKHDVRTVVVKAPDGTTTTTIVDNTVETNDKRKDVSVSKNKQSSALLSVAAKPTSMTRNIYEASLQYRVMGPVFIGATVDTENHIGVIATLEF